jgi:hypothetical protein
MKIAGRGLRLLLAFTAIAVLVAPREALAMEYYTGTVVGVCMTYNGVAYNVKASITAPHWSISDVQYVFIPAPSPLVSQAEPSGKALYFSVPPGNYVVNVVNQANYKVVAPTCALTTKGMTWKLVGTNAPTGTTVVGCAVSCDAYQGDTPCTTALPLLCIKKDGAGFPLPASVSNANIYYTWAGGIVGTTSAIVPPTTLTGANTRCVQEFGAGWRVAEFHDGWGWGFQAYGGIGDPTRRFWVHINDQPGATCWH